MLIYADSEQSVDQENVAEGINDEIQNMSLEGKFSTKTFLNNLNMIVSKLRRNNFDVNL